MFFSKSIHTIDMHCGGDQFRIIAGGIPHLIGNNIFEKIAYLKNQHYWIVQSTMQGIGGMPWGAIITEPTIESADCGIIHIDSCGFSPMCGMGTLALAKAMVGLGMVDQKTPQTKIIMETPAGIVNAYADIHNGEVVNTSFEGSPSFVWRKNAQLTIPSLGSIEFDIVFGGNFYILLDADHYGLTIGPANFAQLKSIAIEILETANQSIHIHHPDNPEITDLKAVLFCEKLDHHQNSYRLQCIFGDKDVGYLVDKSTCGTGSCAILARECADNRLSLQAPLYTEGPMGKGSQFVSKAIGKINIGTTQAILPLVSGKAYFISFNQLLLENDDPYQFVY